MTEPQCRVCKEEIKPGAKLCRHCSSYQNKRREFFRHLGLAIAVVTFIASTSAYTWNATEALRYRFCGEDRFQILSIKTDHLLTLVNDGDGEIFVQQLVITSAKPKYSKVVELHEELKPQTVRTFDVGAQEPPIKTEAMSLDQWSQVLDETSKIRFVPVFYDPDSPVLGILRENLGAELPTIKAQGCVRALIVRRNKPLEVCTELIGAPFEVIEADSGEGPAGAEP